MKAGAAVGRSHGAGGSLVLAEGHPRAADLAFGLAMRAYGFDTHKTAEKTAPGPVTLMATNPEAVARTASPMAAVAEGWGARLVDTGARGHLNGESALGDWPEGHAFLRTLLAVGPGLPSPAVLP